jgi:hypothetical protein
MRPVETIPEVGGGAVKENEGEDELKYDLFDTL